MTDAAQIEVTARHIGVDVSAAVSRLPVRRGVEGAMTVTASELSAIVEPLVSAALTIAVAQAREDALRDAADVVDVHMDAVGESDYGFRVCAAVLALTTKATPDAD